MAKTPYDPPTARVSDPSEPYGVRPLSVGRAVICLWASAGITGAGTVLQLVGVIPTADLTATIVIGLTTFALLAFVAEKIRAGRGWVRWLFLVIYILGSFGFIATMLFLPQVFLAQPLVSSLSYKPQRSHFPSAVRQLHGLEPGTLHRRRVRFKQTILLSFRRNAL